MLQMFRVACLGKPRWGAAGPGVRSWEPGAGSQEPAARSQEPGAGGRGEPGPRGGPVSGGVDGGRGPRHVGTAGVGAQARVRSGLRSGQGKGEEAKVSRLRSGAGAKETVWEP